MELKETIKNKRNDNPIKNFCWPLRGKDKEECVQSYEDVFEEEEERDKGPEEGEAG